MRCDCKTEWKGAYKHSPECAKKRVEWWYENMTYDYECSKCKNSYTVERGIKEAEVLPVCVGCHESMTRVWSSPTVVFNASGFYSTGG